MKLSVDFAFEGFRIIRQRPLLILVWGLFLVIGMGLGYGLFFAMAGSQLLAFIKLAASGGASSDPSAILGLLGALLPAGLLAFLIVGLVQVMLKCAVFRMSFGTKQTGLGGLRFGGDELRQIGVGILYFFVYLGVDIGLSIATGIVGLILTMIFNAVSQNLAAIGMGIGMLLHYGALIWFICRMSLFSAQTFDEKNVNLFGTWKLTNGNFWPLLLGYILAGILMLVVYLLCAVVFGVGFAVLAVGHPLPQITDAASFMKAWQAFLPLLVLGGLAMWIVLPLITTIIYGAPAAAYRQLTGKKPRSIDVF